MDLKSSPWLSIAVFGKNKKFGVLTEADELFADYLDTEDTEDTVGLFFLFFNGVSNGQNQEKI